MIKAPSIRNETRVSAWFYLRSESTVISITRGYRESRGVNGISNGTIPARMAGASVKDSFQPAFD